jgi:hypothetical protein
LDTEKIEVEASGKSVIEGITAPACSVRTTEGVKASPYAQATANPKIVSLRQAGGDARKKALDVLPVGGSNAG